MEKSHVSMEQQVCLVCGHQFDTGAILLDRRLQPSMERTTVTGIGLCPEHKQKHEEGYVALVAIDPARSKQQANGEINPADAYRLGPIVHLKREAAKRLFTIPAETIEQPMLFIEAEVATLLQKMHDSMQRP